MAAMEPQRVFGYADERLGADAKSQRPDTPKLVSRSCGAERIAWIMVANKPAHQGDCV